MTRIEDPVLLAENFACNSDIYTKTIGWTVPDAQTLYTLTACTTDKRVLSVYAGGGYLENLLTTNSRESLHTTVEQEKVVLHKHTGNRHVNIINVEAIEAVRRYTEFDTLLMIMPPCEDTQAIECIREFTGDTVILICTKEFIKHNQQQITETNLKISDVPTKTLLAEEPFERLVIKILHKI